jgi:hypothetical protein
MTGNERMGIDREGWSQGVVAITVLFLDMIFK